MERLMKVAVLALALIGLWSLSSSTLVQADETGTVDAKEVEANAARAKQILKAMSDYMSGQKDISLQFDLDLEAITPDLLRASNPRHTADENNWDAKLGQASAYSVAHSDECVAPLWQATS